MAAALEYSDPRKIRLPKLAHAEGEEDRPDGQRDDHPVQRSNDETMEIEGHT